MAKKEIKKVDRTEDYRDKASFTAPVELMDKLRKIAAEEERSLSSLIVYFLKKEVRRYEKEQREDF